MTDAVRRSWGRRLAPCLLLAVTALAPAKAVRADHDTASRATSVYYPPPESRGGWRSLVPLDATPTVTQKASVRSLARIDWDKLRLAHEYSRGAASDSTLLVIRSGYVVGEWGGREARGVASISKSLAGLAVAKLLDLAAAGQLPRPITLDSYAHVYLPPSWAPPGSAKRQIRIRHLLTMTSGLQPHDRPGAPNYMSLILGLPLQHAPGSRWAYASAPVDLLSLVASAVAGGTLRDFFNRHIAAPLGIPAVAWGNIAGQSATGASSKASMRSRDLARIGYLLMQRGHWAADGTARRVLSPARVEAMVSGLGLAGSLHLPTAGSSFPVASDSPRFYGQLWWSNRTASALGAKVPRDAFYAHGLLEKLLVVVPSLDLLVVRYGSGPRAQIGFKRELMSRIIDALL